MAAQFLETENSDLKMKVEELKKQTEMLLEKLKKYEQIQHYVKHCKCLLDKQKPISDMVMK